MRRLQWGWRRYFSGATVLLLLALIGWFCWCWQRHQAERQQIIHLFMALQNVAELRKQLPALKVLQDHNPQPCSDVQPTMILMQWLQQHPTNIQGWQKQLARHELHLLLTWPDFLQLIAPLSKASQSLSSWHLIVNAQGSQLAMTLWIE